MVLMRGCCCWSDLRFASVGAGAFCIGVSMVQLFLWILFLVSYGSAYSFGAGTTGAAGDAVAIAYYVPVGLYLFFDLLMILVAGFMVSQAHKDGSRGMLLPFIVVTPFYILFEAGLYLYYFIVTGSTLAAVFQAALGPAATIFIGMYVLMLVYWILKLILYIVCLLVIISRYQELGLFKRRHDRYDRYSDRYDNRQPQPLPPPQVQAPYVVAPYRGNYPTYPGQQQKMAYRY